MGGRVKCPYSVSTESTQRMNLTPIAANQTVLSFTNGAQVFFSYKTPVAAYCPFILFQTNEQQPTTICRIKYTTREGKRPC